MEEEKKFVFSVWSLICGLCSLSHTGRLAQPGAWLKHALLNPPASKEIQCTESWFGAILSSPWLHLVPAPISTWIFSLVWVLIVCVCGISLPAPFLSIRRTWSSLPANDPILLHDGGFLVQSHHVLTGLAAGLEGLAVFQLVKKPTLKFALC